MRWTLICPVVAVVTMFSLGFPVAPLLINEWLWIGWVLLSVVVGSLSVTLGQELDYRRERRESVRQFDAFLRAQGWLS